MPSRITEEPLVKKKAKKKATKKKAKKKAKKGSKKTPKRGKKDGSRSFADRVDKIRGRYEKPIVIYEDDAEPPRYRTRFVRLNRLLGHGGIKHGGIMEIYGPEDSAKTSIAIALAADIQAAAPEGCDKVLMLNYEMPYDFKWWRILGLKTDRAHFVMLQPKTLEEGMADMADLVETGEVCAVIIDSVYAASAKDSRDVMKNWADPKKGGGTGGGISVEARQWAAAWTATKGMFVEYDTICIAVNQARFDMNMRGGKARGAGPRMKSTRGDALKFYAWIRLELRGSVLVDGENNMRTDVDGRRVKIRVIKNKTSDKARGIAFYDVIRGDGFDLTQEVIDLALEFDVITHNGGGHYVCWNGKKIHGKAKLRDWIEFTPKVKDVLIRAVEKYLERQEVEEDEEDEFSDEE